MKNDKRIATHMSQASFWLSRTTKDHYFRFTQCSKCEGYGVIEIENELSECSGCGDRKGCEGPLIIVIAVSAEVFKQFETLENEIYEMREKYKKITQEETQIRDEMKNLFEAGLVPAERVNGAWYADDFQAITCRIENLGNRIVMLLLPNDEVEKQLALQATITV